MNPVAPASHTVRRTPSGGFGFHPLVATCDREVLAAILRPRSFKLASDSTAPATGTFGYTSGYFKTASVSVTFTKGTDGSGLNTTSGLAPARLRAPRRGRLRQLRRVRDHR
jgi:hypothetical protein